MPGTQAHAARLILLSLALFLVLFPLGIVRPGWPLTLKADEPAYYGMALSLAHDFDVRCDLVDARRLTEAFPYLPVNNLILMSDDGWETAYFGKPWVYPALAAPAVRWFGHHGMVAVNMLLLLGLVWMGATYLARFNQWPLALLFSAGFFVLSTAFVYVFWLQPEIFNMASIGACLFLAFHRPDEAPRGGGRLDLLRVLGSGAVLALAVYHKPVFAAMGLPALWVVYRRRGLKAAGAWIAAAAVALGLLAGVSYALSGHPTAYLGAARGGVILEDPTSEDDYLDSLRRFVELRGDTEVNSWTWIFRVPEVDPGWLRENLAYFLWGRHTGLLLYMPLAALAVLLFLLHTPRSGERWLLLASMAVVGLFFLFFIPFNWHGGGGFVGNRYFVSVYPAFLFLVTRLRPRWTVPAGFAVGALLLGPLVFSPFGAPVPSPTLQAHTRNFPFRELPLELTLRRQVPGYDGTTLGGIRFVARTDLVRTWKNTPGALWIQGGTETEVLMLSHKPLARVLFEVGTLARDNRVRLALGGDEEVVVFEDAGPKRRQQVVELLPDGPDRMSFDPRRPIYVYNLTVEPENGRMLRDAKGHLAQPIYYFGASLTYLGRREQLESEEHYRAAWESVAAAPSVEASGALTVLVSVRNLGETPWSSEGATPVNLAYHWLDASGETVLFEGRRTVFPEQVEPGSAAEVMMSIAAPDTPGSYTLVLDLVRENVAWFSQRGSATHQLEVEVTPPGRGSAERKRPRKRAGEPVGDPEP